MTNAEKFEEVFGIKIDEDYPSDICQSVVKYDCYLDYNGENYIINRETGEYIKCVEHNCSDCPIFKFWDQEYKEDVK